MKPARPKLLIVDDDADLLGAMERLLRRDFCCATACSPDELRHALRSGADLLLLDIRLNSGDAENRDGLRLLSEVKRTCPDLPIVMMTAYGDMDIAVEAMRLGAADFIDKTRATSQEIRKTLLKVIEEKRLRRRVVGLEREVSRLSEWELIGDHRVMEALRASIDMVAGDGQVTVLVCGETGTGKELVARAIHSRGRRKGQPFTPVALCALGADVVDSELFGSVPGGFTDARSRTGYIGDADGGILFLDEVAATPLASQPRLLRFLEDRTYHRVGSTETLSVDVQVVAATNRDLLDLCDRRAFREDLYYRLKAFVIDVPPLRARKDDIPDLVRHFLKHLRHDGRTAVRSVEGCLFDFFSAYDWPGNVRELRNVVERLVLLSGPESQVLTADHLPAEFCQHSRADTACDHSSALHMPFGCSLDEMLARHELEYIETALRETDGRKAEAAERIGLHDRFALRRRVNSIAKRFPHLISEAHLVSELFRK